MKKFTKKNTERGPVPEIRKQLNVSQQLLSPRMVNIEKIRCLEGKAVMENLIDKFGEDLKLT